MGGGPGGAACKSITAASLYHSFQWIQYHLVISKMDPCEGCRFGASCQMAFFSRVMVGGITTQWFDSTDIHDEIGGAGGSYPFRRRNYANTKFNMVIPTSRLTLNVCISNLHITSMGKCDHQEQYQLHRPGLPPKRHCLDLLKARRTQRHCDISVKKKKKETPGNGFNPTRTWNVRATRHRFCYKYLQFHHVCTARRGNSLPWLHPMAHRFFFFSPPTGCFDSVRMRLPSDS